LLGSRDNPRVSTKREGRAPPSLSACHSICMTAFNPWYPPPFYSRYYTLGRFDCRPWASYNNETRGYQYNATEGFYQSYNATQEHARAYHSERRPIRWLHVPKTGSSLINVLVRLADCPLPQGAGIKMEASWLLEREGPGGYLGDWYWACFREESERMESSPHLRPCEHETCFDETRR
jgi:hypothetical protein